MKCPHCDQELVGIEDLCDRCGGVVPRAPHPNDPVARSIGAPRRQLEYSVMRKSLEEQWAEAARRALDTMPPPPPNQRMLIAGAIVAAAAVCSLIAVIFG